MPEPSPFDDLKFDDLLHTPETIAEFIDGLSVQKYSGKDRRSEKRFSLNARGIVQPLNENREPEGDSFSVIIKDISLHGIGLFIDIEIENRLLAVRIESATDPEPKGINVVMEVLRCRNVTGSLYDIGGRLLTRESESSE